MHYLGSLKSLRFLIAVEAQRPFRLHPRPQAFRAQSPLFATFVTSAEDTETTEHRQQTTETTDNQLVETSFLRSEKQCCEKLHLHSTNIARIANAVQVPICLLVSTSVY